MTRAIFTALALCCATFGGFVLLAPSLSLAAPAADSASRITAKAVWTPTPEQLSDIRRKCTEGDPAQHETCFLNAMKSAGASDEAMAFVKEFAANGLAYVRAFRDTGRVDIAYIEYLFRANNLDGVLLVNGTPPIIDVDDYKFLSQEDLSKNDAYAALLQKYPNVNVFPGDRYHTDWPKTILSSAGQKFEVSYLLLNGCHACEGIGTAIMAFDFDSHGRFAKARLMDVQTGGDSNKAELSDEDRPVLSRRPEPGSPEDAKESKINPTEIHSKVGTSFTIILPANHTTGYSWRLAKPVDPNVLTQLSKTYSEDNSTRIGSGGRELWTFEPLRKGTTDIEFEYARPFEKNAAPVNTAKYKVEIK
jgi:predicted secreted protein